MNLELPFLKEEGLLEILEQIGRKDDLVLKALELSKDIHKDEIRKWDNSRALETHIYPTIKFLIAHYQAYNKIPSLEVIAAELIHDTKERNRNIENEFYKKEFNDTVYEYVMAVTKPPYQDYEGNGDFEKKRKVNEVYFPKISNSPIEVKLMKLADRYSNLLTINSNTPPEKIAFWLREMEDFYLNLALKNSSNYFYYRMRNRVEEIKALELNILAGKQL